MQRTLLLLVLMAAVVLVHLAGVVTGQDPTDRKVGDNRRVNSNIGRPKGWPNWYRKRPSLQQQGTPRFSKTNKAHEKVRRARNSAPMLRSNTGLRKGSNYSFASYLRPNRFIRHRYHLAEVSDVISDLDRKDATFRVVPGLADQRHVSFESVNYPGHYLRHEYLRVKLQKFTETQLFRKDATFKVHRGLADASQVSFESYNYADRFVREKDSHLYLDEGNTAAFRNDATFKPVAPKWSTKWTVMVYVDGDNNLEDAGLDDFLEMAQVGSSADVNIVVQMDRTPGWTNAYGNWTGTRRFLVDKGDTPDVTPLPHLGEQNMGSAQVLQDFVEWAMSNYEAEHYALVIWNHGDGWRAMQQILTARQSRRSGGAVARAIAWDDTDQDELYMREVQDALQDALANVSRHYGRRIELDIIGFDACLMGMIEVAYATRNVAKYMVGSENTEPYDGWPYDTILQELVNAPAMSARNLSRLIVDKYYESYPNSRGITQSAVDIHRVRMLATAIDNFASLANSEWTKLQRAREASLTYHPSVVSNAFWGVDLWDFADEVHHRVSSARMRIAARQLKNKIDQAVIHERHSNDMVGSHGIAIYFPATKDDFDNDPDHVGYLQSNTDMPVDFVLRHNWDEWLKRFYSASSETEVSVRVWPKRLDIAWNQTIKLTAEVTGTTETGVRWQLKRGDGYLSRDPRDPPNVIRYNAPGHNTRAHICAISLAAPNSTDTAVITVLKSPR